MVKNISCAIALIAILASCSNPFAAKAKPSGSGAVTVRIVNAGARAGASRTVVPDFSTATGLTYKVTLTSQDAYATKTESDIASGSDFTFFNVEAGTWDVMVEATRSVGALNTLIATGFASGQVVAPEVTTSIPVSVMLIPAAISTVLETGEINFSAHLPSTAGISSVEFSLYDQETLVDSKTVTPNPIGATQFEEAIYSTSNVNDGAYSLAMTFKRAGAIVGQFRESVNVWSDLVSDKWVKADGSLADYREFGQEEFLNGNAELFDLGLTASASPIAFASSVSNYDIGLVSKGSTISFTPTVGVAGQTMEFAWNGGAPCGILSGKASAALSLVEGINSLYLTVTAPDRTTTKLYILVMRWVPAYAGTSGLEMAKILSGSFAKLEGSSAISSFLIGKYEVSQAQYAAVMSSNPSAASGATNPVETVSWYGALVFCNKLSLAEGLAPVYSIAGSVDPAAWGAIPTAIWDATYHPVDWVRERPIQHPAGDKLLVRNDQFLAIAVDNGGCSHANPRY